MVVIGAGGHAKTVLHTLQNCQRDISGILDQKQKDSETVLGVDIIGDIPRFIRHVEENSFIVAIGDNVTRMEHFNRIRLKKGQLTTLIDPNASVAASATVGAGSLVAQGAMVCPNAAIGINVIINSRALIEHDSQIGDHVHIAPDASLAGKVQVGEGSFIGLRAMIRDKVSIGKWARVGAGAVVVSDVPDGATVVGNPARITNMEQHPSPTTTLKPTVSHHCLINTALEQIDFYGSGYVLVLNDDRCPVGIVTDGTVRRALLKGVQLDDSIQTIMDTDFFTLDQDKENEAVHHFSHMIKFIPIVNENGALTKIIHPSDVFSVKPKASDRASLQTKALFQWAKHRKHEVYRPENLKQRIVKLCGHEELHLWPSAQMALEQWIEQTTAWCWSESAKNWWNSSYTQMPNQQAESKNNPKCPKTVICTDDEFNRLPEGPKLVISGSWSSCRRIGQPTLLRCCPEDELNLEGGAIFFHPKTEQPEQGSLHPMQIASALHQLIHLESR